jgi:hypothetical protein
VRSFRIGFIDAHLIRHKKEMLDLSLTVRFANLPAGCKLDLVRLSADMTAKTATVQIALQTEEGARFIDSFNTSMTFWQIMEHFERQHAYAIDSTLVMATVDYRLNLTKREAVPKQTDPAKKMSLKSLASKFKNIVNPTDKVYLQPVCVVMNREVLALDDSHR